VLTKRLLTALMIVVIVATIIGLAGLFRAQMVEHRASTLRAENEVSAIRSLRAIGAAQARYRQRCTGYASLGELIRAGELPSVRLTGDTTTTADGYTITVDTTGAAIPATGLPPNCIGTRTDFFRPRRSDRARPDRDAILRERFPSDDLPQLSADDVSAAWPVAKARFLIGVVLGI
jgi:hypothetical protein